LGGKKRGNSVSLLAKKGSNRGHGGREVGPMELEKGRKQEKGVAKGKF